MISIEAELFDARDDLINYRLWRIGVRTHGMINTIFWALVICLMVMFRVGKGSSGYND
ncbi:hypothetical protein [Acinetobacter sp. ANC 4779]|uniref:hypothetical protein n=1 Tax=Acinetobacter sp. ANC 4779 TaxID=2529848 RepID=UPI001D18C80A|nr:hypothetical protein [Acinetobacter sp. ANC 4779]